MPRFPHIIQTIVPDDRNPAHSLVATWVKFGDQKPDLKPLVSQLSVDLRKLSTIDWDRDVVGQPQRLLAVVCTGDLEILRRGKIKDDLIGYLNRFTLEPAIVVEEAPLPGSRSAACS